MFNCILLVFPGAGPSTPPNPWVLLQMDQVYTLISTVFQKPLLDHLNGESYSPLLWPLWCPLEPTPSVPVQVPKPSQAQRLRGWISEASCLCLLVHICITNRWSPILSQFPFCAVRVIPPPTLGHTVFPNCQHRAGCRCTLPSD